MAEPLGTTTITYIMSQYGGGGSPEIELRIGFEGLTPGNADVVDRAAEAAMTTFVAYLEQAFPGVPVGTDRTYTSVQIDSSWNAPAPDPTPPPDWQEPLPEPASQEPSIPPPSS